MAEGRVNTAQARAIVAALDRLPTTGEFAVNTEQRGAAETHLVAMAEHHDAKALRILGGRIFEVIAPDLAEKFDGQALEAEEARALRRTTLDHVGGRRRHLPRTLPHPRTARADAHQDDPRDHLTVPLHQRHDASSGSGIDPDLPTPVRHGIALTQLIETYPAEKLPKTGGCSATVVVTMTLEQLTGRPRPRRGLHPGHRRTHHRRRSPPTRLHRRDHPRRPRRQEPGPRRRPQTTTAHRVDAPRDGRARRRLHRRRAAKPTRPLPRPPQHPLVPRRIHQRRRRPTALPPPPPPHPRPSLRDPTPTRREGQLPPADVNRRCLHSGSSRFPKSENRSHPTSASHAEPRRRETQVTHMAAKPMGSKIENWPRCRRPRWTDT